MGLLSNILNNKPDEEKAFILQVILLLSNYSYAQSSAVMTASMGANTNGLQTVLYFEEIGYEKV